jgi:hypothetical protein
MAKLLKRSITGLPIWTVGYLKMVLSGYEDTLKLHRPVKVYVMGGAGVPYTILISQTRNGKKRGKKQTK